jgi:hypothetical protein
MAKKSQLREDRRKDRHVKAAVKKIRAVTAESEGMGFWELKGENSIALWKGGN